MRWKVYFDPTKALRFLISKGVVIIDCNPIIQEYIDNHSGYPGECFLYNKEEPECYKDITSEMIGDVILKIKSQKFLIRDIGGVGDTSFDIKTPIRKIISYISTKFRLFTPIVGLSRYAAGDIFTWDNDEDRW